MRIVETYSHLGGEEFLLVRCPALLQEVKDTIESVDVTDCAKSVLDSDVQLRRKSVSPAVIKDEFTKQFGESSWRKRSSRFWVARDAELTRTVARMPVEIQPRAIKLHGSEPISASLAVDFFKDRIAIQLQLGHPSKIAHDIFVTYMNFYVSDLMDVGIEIMPTKELAAQMSSGVPYYERDLLNIIRQGRGVPAVPLVLMGIAP
ncbi:MAG: BglII/BstYI family type II restriction endonuclease [Chloroflexi bacterium]|nr:BglII/BstYI family type II restriction endonuclease [Chloroflexota bacterium]